MADSAVWTAGADTVAEHVDGWIVLGYDGSVKSRAAFALALDLAEHLSVPLAIVRAWRFDTAPSGAVFQGGYASSFEEIGTAVHGALEREVAETLAAHEAVRVECFAVQGPTAQVLVASAARARMLVLGRRGLGGFASLMLGSVSDQCVRHATCPVTVV